MQRQIPVCKASCGRLRAQKRNPRVVVPEPSKITKIKITVGSRKVCFIRRISIKVIVIHLLIFIFTLDEWTRTLRKYANPLWTKPRCLFSSRSVSFYVNLNQKLDGAYFKGFCCLYMRNFPWLVSWICRYGANNFRLIKKIAFFQGISLRGFSRVSSFL